MTLAMTTNSLTRVQKRRNAQGWTQAEIAHRCKLTARTIWAVENRKPVRPTTVRKLLKALRLAPEEWQDWFAMAPQGATRSGTRRVAR